MRDNGRIGDIIDEEHNPSISSNISSYRDADNGRSFGGFVSFNKSTSGTQDEGGTQISARNDDGSVSHGLPQSLRKDGGILGKGRIFNFSMSFELNPDFEGSRTNIDGNIRAKTNFEHIFDERGDFDCGIHVFEFDSDRIGQGRQNSVGRFEELIKGGAFFNSERELVESRRGTGEAGITRGPESNAVSSS